MENKSNLCAVKPMARTLLLGINVDQESTAELISKIYEINHDDDEKEQEYKNFVREPIKLIIKTYGGYYHDMIGLCGAIELSKTPVHGICLGHAMSAGMPIFLSCSKRSAYRNSTFMYHEIATMLWDKLQSMKEDLAQLEKEQAIYDSYITSKTSIMQERLNQVRERKQDWYINTEDALKLGIIHEIL